MPVRDVSSNYSTNMQHWRISKPDLQQTFDKHEVDWFFNGHGNSLCVCSAEPVKVGSSTQPARMHLDEEGSNRGKVPGRSRNRNQS